VTHSVRDAVDFLRPFSEAAEMVGTSVSGMKSRVQRGRAPLRQLFEDCCEIALDARGKVVDYTRRPRPCGTCG
jgi:RNA polymerase sigma-70 factor (ECF subfamily)